MVDVVVFGTGKYAELACGYFRDRIAAFTVDAAYLGDGEFRGRKVVPFEEVNALYSPDTYKMFVALGYQNLNELRAQKYNQARGKGYVLFSYIHPLAAIGGEVGDNAFILEGASVQPTATIGNNVTLWWSSCIGHHSEVRDHCYLAGHVSVGGNTVIGPHCFVGLNATIGHGITIGAGSLIGAGTLVTKDVPAGTVIARSDTPHHRLDSKAFSSLGRL